MDYTVPVLVDVSGVASGAPYGFDVDADFGQYTFDKPSLSRWPRSAPSVVSS